MFSTYKVIYSVTELARQNYSAEFDVTDQDKWEKLLQLAHEALTDEDLDAFPANEPKDPQIWFSLFRLLYEDAYDQQNIEWMGNPERESWALLDQDGNQIDSQDNNLN